MLTFVRLVVVALAVAWSCAARADAVIEAKEFFDSGNKHYAAGRYEEALNDFKAGYARSPNPKFLLNMGQAYRKLGRLDEARLALLKYMDTLGHDEARRASVARVVAEIDLELRRTQPAGALRPPPLGPPPPPAPMSRARRRARTAGVALVSIGALAVVIGGALVGVAVRDDHLLQNPPPGWVFDPGVVRERDAFAPAGLTLIGVGGAAIASGVGALVYALHSPPTVRASLGAGAPALAVWF
jgi:hypothetical protein